MKKSLLLIILSLLFVPTLLQAQKLKIGASAVPHAQILEAAKPLLAKEGIDLDIIIFQDYILPNKALVSKDIDANYFQHLAFLDQQISQYGYKIVSAGGVHLEPFGIYSKKYTNIKDVQDGATVILSNSVADRGRTLTLLEKAGLIKLNPDVKKVSADFKDIIENTKNIKFKNEIDPALLASAYKNNEADLIIINTNYALEAGLSPIKDALLKEDSTSAYVNIIAVREGDQNKEAIKKLMSVLHSKEIQNFIKTKYEGAIIPVNK